MSWYQKSAHVSGKPSDMEAAVALISQYLIFCDYGEDSAVRWGRDDLSTDAVPWSGLEAGELSCPLGKAIKLTQEEIEILEALPSSIDGYSAEDVFSARFQEAMTGHAESDDDLNEEDFEIWLHELLEKTTLTTFDIFANLGMSEIRVNADASSANYFFNGVGLPGGFSTIGIYRINHQNENSYDQALLRFIIEIDCDVYGRDNRNGYFQFNAIDELLGIGGWIDSRVKINLPDGDWSPVSYRIEINLRCREKELMILLGYRRPENKRLRSKKHDKLYAKVVDVANGVLWDGHDPTELAFILNDWCRSACDNHASGQPEEWPGPVK